MWWNIALHLAAVPGALWDQVAAGYSCNLPANCGLIRPAWPPLARG
jgi:hypothetical protein